MAKVDPIERLLSIDDYQEFILTLDLRMNMLKKTLKKIQVCLVKNFLFLIKQQKN